MEHLPVRTSETCLRATNSSDVARDLDVAAGCGGAVLNHDWGFDGYETCPDPAGTELRGRATASLEEFAPTPDELVVDFGGCPIIESGCGSFVKSAACAGVGKAEVARRVKIGRTSVRRLLAAEKAFQRRIRSGT